MFGPVRSLRKSGEVPAVNTARVAPVDKPTPPRPAALAPPQAQADREPVVADGPTITPAIVGQRLRDAIRAAGLTHASAARSLGMPRTQLVSYCSGRSAPSAHAFLTIAITLGLDLQILCPERACR